MLSDGTTLFHFLRYPLGRVIGGTVYPGLTLTAGTIWWWVPNFPTYHLPMESFFSFRKKKWELSAIGVPQVG